MEIKHIIGNLYSIYGEYYIKTDVKTVAYSPTKINYIRINTQYYINAIDYIQANCKFDIWIYSSRKGIVIELATDELKQNTLEGITTYMNAPYCIKREDDMFKIIFNKN